MADQNDGVTGAQQEGPETEAKAPDQDLEHWKQMSRKNERDAKRTMADLAAAQEAAGRTAADLDAANARIAELEAAAAHDEAVRKVAAEQGIPEAVVRGLRGETAEELAQSAALLKANYSAYPMTRDNGDPRPPSASRESIEAIKDPAERVMARAKNISLYQ